MNVQIKLENCKCGEKEILKRNRTWHGMRVDEIYTHCPKRRWYNFWKHEKDIIHAWIPYPTVNKWKVLVMDIFLKSEPKAQRYPLGQLEVKGIEFIESLLAAVRQETVREQNKNIGQLRVWLNEDRITDPKKMVTNEEIKIMLSESPEENKECECVCHSVYSQTDASVFEKQSCKHCQKGAK